MANQSSSNKGSPSGGQREADWSRTRQQAMSDANRAAHRTTGTQQSPSGGGTQAGMGAPGANQQSGMTSGGGLQHTGMGTAGMGSGQRSAGQAGRGAGGASSGDQHDGKKSGR